MRIIRLILAAALAVSASLAAAQEAVSLRLNWYLGGLHVPFYYGKDMGFFKQEGIDLTINEGRGSGNTVQVVAAGSDTFGMADSSSLITTASKGADVKSVKVDALLGGADDQYFLIKYKGQVPAALRYADHGANIVGMTILTTGNTIKNKPDLVRRFVKASVRSWEEAKKNPNAAVDSAMKVKPDLNRQSTMDQMMVDFELLDSANSKGKVGVGAKADWEQTITLLKQYRDLSTNEPWTTFHTNEFLPK